MKRKSNYSHNDQFGIPSLFIVGCGFVIVILISLFILNYDNYRKARVGLSYLDLEDRYPVIKEDELYDFMNQALFRSDSILVDSLEFTKLNCFSLKHSSELKSFINSLNNKLLSKADKKFMKKQLTNNIYLWDNMKFINVWCLTPKDLSKIICSDTVDYWEGFRSNFGQYGHHHYSKPIFNKNKDICVIEHSWQGDWVMGSGEILLFRKVNGKWRLLKEEELWIS